MADSADKPRASKAGVGSAPSMNASLQPEWGVASHTGLLRSANEDDYIVVDPSDSAIRASHGRMFAVADGMGGVPGGGEASRTALRALARGWLAMVPTSDVDPAAGATGAEVPAVLDVLEERLRAGVVDACRAVFETGRQMPALTDMGCTLTAGVLWNDRLVLGHIGDTRCFLVQQGKLSWLTEDHAAERPQTYLTRCVGGGRPTEEADFARLQLQRGDVVGVASDGIWSVVQKRALVRCLESRSLQAAAEGMVRLANEGGGPDNSTVVLCRLHDCDTKVESVLARGQRERPFPRPYLAPKLRTRPPIWPFLLGAVAVLLLVLAISKQDWLG